MNDFAVYCDGCVLVNPGGPGGWACIVMTLDSEKVLAGGEPDTTNNRMELVAAIAGISSTPIGAVVCVVSDSQYVCRATTQEKTHSNHDLIERIRLACAVRNVTFQWIKGHAGHKLNERADKLAYKEAKKFEKLQSPSELPKQSDRVASQHREMSACEANVCAGTHPTSLIET